MTNSLIENSCLHDIDRVALLIDGYHARAIAVQMDVTPDFRAVHHAIKSVCRLQTARYYTAVPNNPEEEHGHARLLDWLDFHNFKTTRIPCDHPNPSTVAVEMALDAITLADSMDHIILAAGLPCYERVVTEVQARGCAVSIWSNREFGFATTSLVRAADEYMDLGEFFNKTGKPFRRHAEFRHAAE